MENNKFTKEDLDRLAHIEADPDKTDNEEFLMVVVDKFFIRTAELWDKLEQCQYDIKEQK